MNMHTRRNIFIACAMSLVAASALPLTAHAQGVRKGPNGGMVGGSNGHEVELVISGAEASVYVLDDGKVVAVGKAQLRMVVQSGGKTTNPSLTLAEPNRLAAKFPEPLPKGSIVVITGRDDHGHTLTARFTIP